MRLIVMTLFCCMALTACNVSNFLFDARDTTLDETLLADGQAVFLENYCGSCHQLDVANTRGSFGPDLNDIALVAQERIQNASYTGNASSVPDYIEESLLTPQLYIAEGYEATHHRMPTFTHLAEADLEALIYFLSHQQ